jgi:ABC-2 type transport system permease protein
LFIFIFTSLWAAIYAQSGDAGIASGFDGKKIITYAVYAMLIRISMTMEDGDIGRKVRSGAISMDLIKPVNFFGMSIAESMGQTLFHWFTRVIPILILVMVMFDAPLPTNPLNYLLMAIAWIAGYLIMFLLNFTVSLLSFWFTETFSFQLMKFGLLTLFGGAILPIDFFPDWAQPLIALIPFQYIFYAPTAVFIGHLQGAAAFHIMLLQWVWVALLGLTAFILWRAGQRKLVFQGG